MKYNKIVIFDLELTCFQTILSDGTEDRTPPPGQLNEIIEIGYVIADLKTRTISEPKSYLIKPTQSIISDYCTQITNITPELLDKEGISFNEAMDNILNQKIKGYPICGYGPGDYPLLLKECERYGVTYPLSHTYIDLKVLYALRKGNRKAAGLKKNCQLENIQFKGAQHRAGVDAYATAELFLKIF